eukprot:gene5459-5859_t
MIAVIAIFFLPVIIAQRGNRDHRHHVLKGVVSNETFHCDEIKKQLFHSTESIDIQRIEWERFLPVFLKTQIFDLQREKNPTKGWEMEFVHSEEHGRFHMLGPVGPTCKTPLEHYGNGDEEKRACGLQQLQKIDQVSTGESKNECVIYSIGSGGKWNFEEEIVQKTDCRVETFDCTVGAGYKPPDHIKHRVRFHYLCLSDSDYELNGLKFVSWPTLNKITGVSKPPTFLKMDIEGYEFPVMKSIIDSGVMLPLQIAMEVHYIRVIGGKTEDRRANSAELLAFANYLYKFGGYYLIDRHDNPFCKHCTEIVLAKLNCENYPRPSNYKELLLPSENKQEAKFEKTVRESLQAKYYS